ncbi:MAG: sensor histidine kinase [Pseudobdellovibrio sp.]
MLYRSYSYLKFCSKLNLNLNLIISTLLFFSLSSAKAVEKTDSFFNISYSECKASDLILTNLDYQNVESNQLSLGYSPKNFCVKLQFDNVNQSFLENKVLYLSSYSLMNVDIFQIQQDQLVQVEKLKTRLTAIDIKNSSAYYFFIKTHHNIDTKFEIISAEDFRNKENKFVLLLVFYVGFVLALIIYNFSIGLMTKSMAYLLYSLFSLSFLMTSIVINGVVDFYLLPNCSNFFIKHLMLFSGVSLLMATLFAQSYLQIKKVSNRLFITGFNIIICFAIFFILASWIIEFYRSLFWIGILIDITLVGSLVYFIVVSYLLFRDGLTEAVYYLMSWVFVIGSVVLWFAFKHEYLLIIGNAAELTTLSLGLAYRINRLSLEKNIAEKNVLFLSKYKRLLKVISHDVSNAITIIKLALRKAKNNTHIDEQMTSSVQKIDNSTNKIIEILKTVKAEENLHLSTDGLYLVKVQLKDCIYKCISLFDDLLELKGLKVHVLVGENDSVYADASVLTHQILGNIISNAIKFSEAGQHIIIKFYLHDGHKVIEIRDNGVGISAEKINEIFYSDIQITTKGTHGELGTGYGSSIISHYVKAMGAKLIVESKEQQLSIKDHGTSIKIVFP